MSTTAFLVLQVLFARLLTFLVLPRCSSHQVQLGLKSPLSEQRPNLAVREISQGRPPAIPTTRSDAKEQETNVLYVAAGNAKTIKTALEEAGYLDKRYRMIKAESGPSLEDPAGIIAVPVTNECMAALANNEELPDWFSLLVTTGIQKVPFSTAVLGQQMK